MEFVTMRYVRVIYCTTKWHGCCNKLKINVGVPAKIIHQATGKILNWRKLHANSTRRFLHETQINVL